jgi:hypothetical protein
MCFVVVYMFMVRWCIEEKVCTYHIVTHFFLSIGHPKLVKRVKVINHHRSKDMKKLALCGITA